jgi:hypothetical protein
MEYKWQVVADSKVDLLRYLEKLEALSSVHHTAKVCSAVDS